MKDPLVCEEIDSVGGEDTQRGRQEKDAKAQPASSSRRSFCKVGGATAIMLAAGVPLEPLFEGKHGQAQASVVQYGPAARTNASFDYRVAMAESEKIDVGELPDNGDSRRFTDFSGSWSKALRHDALGIPNAASWLSLTNALYTGQFQDFESILVGTPGGHGANSMLNGPQTSLAFDMEGCDSHATNFIPAAPSVASAQTAAEQVEHYWGALLRDVKFTDYATNPLAAHAASDLNNLSYVHGNQNQEFPYPVTPHNLFRGQFYPGDGNVQGPYLSQFLIQPTFYGAQPLTQQYQRFLSLSEGGADYMTGIGEYQNIENGVAPTRKLKFDPTYRYMRMGRDLAAYAHVDVLYQAYFVAFLVLSGLGAPSNPGNPYIGSQTERPFGTLGAPDSATTLAEMATRALKASWFHKWIVNLRMRPEEYGALVQTALMSSRPAPQAARALNSDVLRSTVLPLIHAQYGSYLLPQAYPEGAPPHPCYPTGHGTVGGACITALKFFYDGSKKIRPLLQAVGSDVYVPSEDGLSLVPYTGADRDRLTINGELAKLGFNISIGHGIHAGIHFRSSTLQSLLLGEQVAISVLNDRAKSYNEPFTISITKFDGTTATISNQT